MRCLISCPKCESEGRKYILGELAPTGHVLIQRVHGKNGEYRNFTIVGGSDFYLVCDHCGMKIFFREIPSSIMSGTVERRDYGTVSLFRQSWLLGGSLGTETETIGTGSITA